MFNITILILFLGTDADKTPVEPSMFTLEYIKFSIIILTFFKK